MSCLTPAPAIGWVCQDGNWLPPGHPDIRPQNPVIADPSLPFLPTLFGGSVAIWPPPPIPEGPNKWIIERAYNGETLPPGYIGFQAPLVLRDTATLRGTGGRTYLIPNNPYTGPLIVLQTCAGGNYELKYPMMLKLEDLFIIGTHKAQKGIVISGGNIRLQGLNIMGCGDGIYVNFGVNVAIRDCVISQCNTGINIIGMGKEAQNSITTLRISGCRIGYNDHFAIRVRHGMGVMIDDSTTLEGNPGIALSCEPLWPEAELTVRLRDAWFEANGVDINDPTGRITREGFNWKRPIE